MGVDKQIMNMVSKGDLIIKWNAIHSSLFKKNTEIKNYCLRLLKLKNKVVTLLSNIVKMSYYLTLWFRIAAKNHQVFKINGVIFHAKNH